MTHENWFWRKIKLLHNERSILYGLRLRIQQICRNTMLNIRRVFRVKGRRCSENGQPHASEASSKCHGRKNSVRVQHGNAVIERISLGGRAIRGDMWWAWLVEESAAGTLAGGDSREKNIRKRWTWSLKVPQLSGIRALESAKRSEAERPFTLEEDDDCRYPRPHARG